MKTLQLSAHVAADGMLHIPITAPDFADRDVDVVVILPTQQTETQNVLIGRDALQLAQKIGFIGSLEAEAEFSSNYKNELDWSHKT
ncbi:MAG: hypothetical protein WCI11_19310 [Candidatus Methylumidiphilus sp.]